MNIIVSLKDIFCDYLNYTYLLKCIRYVGHAQWKH